MCIRDRDVYGRLATVLENAGSFTVAPDGGATTAGMLSRPTGGQTMDFRVSRVSRVGRSRAEGQRSDAGHAGGRRSVSSGRSMIANRRCRGRSVLGGQISEADGGVPPWLPPLNRPCEDVT